MKGSFFMQHLAIIPDGNRRWAAANKLEAFWGHKKGLDAVELAIKVCLEQGVKFLTFYTFSLENFRRSETEKNYLFNEILAKEFTNALPRLLEQNVRVRFLGDASYFPAVLQPIIARVQEATVHCDGLTLNLLFCYGGRQEIAYAARQLALKVAAGDLKPEAITDELLATYLWTAGMPDPEIIVRTGNTSRLSNFLLYQGAYSEIINLDCFWPDITEARLKGCIDIFNATKRNFGT